MRDEVLIKVEGVSKKFCRSLKKSLWYGLKDIAGEVVGCNGNLNQLRPLEFWAVNDVSFQLRRGECLGLIGRNGAGKTTLLKMLNGLIKPDRGRIEMRGHLGALIALGAGFNPILTGRENIYVNGSVLGLTKREIDAKIAEIIDFADIGDFIDTPVQSYSSGMQVRLGFAIATALNPDILLLDEVLAVGDASFRHKCYNRIGNLRQSSATIFVSHSMDQVGQFCDRLLVLSAGRAVHDGDVSYGINIYEGLQGDGSGDDIMTFERVIPPVTAVKITINPAKISHGAHVQFRMEVYSERPVFNTILKIVFYDQQHSPCAEWNSERIGYSMSLRKGANAFQVSLGPMLLKTGIYRLGVVLNDDYRITMLVWSFKKHEVNVDGFTALGPPLALCSPLHSLNE